MHYQRQDGKGYGMSTDRSNMFDQDFSKDIVMIGTINSQLQDWMVELKENASKESLRLNKKMR